MHFEHIWPAIPSVWPPEGHISPSRHAIAGAAGVFFEFDRSTWRRHSRRADLHEARRTALAVANAHETLANLHLQAISLLVPSRVRAMHDLYPVFTTDERDHVDEELQRSLAGDPGVVIVDHILGASSPDRRRLEMPWSLVSPGLNEQGIFAVVSALAERLGVPGLLDLGVVSGAAFDRGGHLGDGWGHRELCERTTLTVEAGGRNPVIHHHSENHDVWSCPEAPIKASLLLVGSEWDPARPTGLLWWLTRLFERVTRARSGYTLAPGTADVVVMDVWRPAVLQASKGRTIVAAEYPNA